jgi:Na+(H+)/acetate symporter ActP
MAKIPMQFFILFIGAIVYVFFIFERPPLLFQPVELKHIQADARFPAAERRYQEAFAHRRDAAAQFLQANRSGDSPTRTATIQRYRDAQKELNDAHTAGERLVGKEFDDTNYIFLSFVTRYLPAGLVGLIIAVIFSAAMSSTSGEINSLATVTVIDIYRRHINRNAPDHHYLLASRCATLFWGLFAIGFAQYGRNFGALIQAVNIIGSLFYGGLLGVFVLAFCFKSVGANGAFCGVLAGEAAIFAADLFTKISFLWFNVVGCLVVVAVGVIVSRIFDGDRRPAVVVP